MTKKVERGPEQMEPESGRGRSTADFVTHYQPAEDAPFQNLSDAPQDDLPAIIEHLQKRREAGSRRIFGRAYMDYRRHTEA